MKRETIFLRVVVFLMAIPVLGLCIFIVPKLAEFYVELIPKLAYLQYPFIVFLYASALAYFFALYQTLKLLGYIDKNSAFSDLSVKAIKNIKFCAITITVLIAACMPQIYLMADADDAPGLILIAMGFTGAPLVISVFAAVLQKLLENAIAIKSENDLTV